MENDKELEACGPGVLRRIRISVLYGYVNVWMWESLRKTWWKMEWGKTGKVNIEYTEKG